MNRRERRRAYIIPEVLAHYDIDGLLDIADGSADETDTDSDSTIEILDDYGMLDVMQQPAAPQAQSSQRSIGADEAANKENASQPRDEIDAANTCLICTEMWTSEGEHQLVVLRCGHLFGQSCLNEWLKPSRRTQRCPQCNQPAKRKDMIRIYAQNLRPLDTRALEDAHKSIERYKRNFEDARAEIVSLREKNVKLAAELNILKMDLVKRNLAASNARPELMTNDVKANFFLSYLKDISIRDQDCRHQFYSNLLGALIISASSSTAPSGLNLPRHGVVRIGLDDSLRQDTIYIHNDPMIDMVLDQYDGTLVSVSRDKTLKITSLLSKAAISTLTNLPWPVKCVLPWERNRNVLFLGLNTGKVVGLDKRYLVPEPYFQLDTFIPKPVISICSMEYKTLEGSNEKGILVVNLDGATVFTSSNDFHDSHSQFRLPFKGIFTGCDYEPESGLVLLSARPSSQHSHATHYLMDMQEYRDTSKNTNEIMPTVVQAWEGGKRQTLLTRSRLAGHPTQRGGVIMSACEEDEFTGACLWSYPSGERSQIITNSLVRDVLPIDVERTGRPTLVSCLVDNTVKLYKINH